VLGTFQDRVSQTICPSWFWTLILVISASSWVDGIIGMSHQCPASGHFASVTSQKVPRLRQVCKKSCDKPHLEIIWLVTGCIFQLETD
jgi:hypothetical protein